MVWAEHPGRRPRCNSNKIVACEQTSQLHSASFLSFLSSFGYILVYGWYIANLANSLNRRKMQQGKASTNKTCKSKERYKTSKKTAKLPAWENSHNNKNKHNCNDNDNKENNNKDPCFCCGVVWGRRPRGMGFGMGGGQCAMYTVH